ncbi:MAG: VWA domain-containing protein [Anaerolineales bacterium]|nr:VWA domain-containing protein [Anaerolineales bacterium]
MSLLWPGFLLLWALIPALIALYVWRLRRRQTALRYSSLSLVRAAVPARSRLRRHVPFALFSLALAGLVFALGRPATVVGVPTSQTVILLTIDVSRSMCWTDIEPSRLEAAQAAALNFVQNQPAGTRIGIVAFSGFAELIQPPTEDLEVLQDAIESLATGRRTAIGSGLLEALDAIAEIDPSVAPSTLGPADGPPPTPVLPGAYAPAIIVLLTDGASNAGPLPVEAAQQAADRGVRVYTIGFGTELGGAGRPPVCGRQFLGNEPPDREQFFGGGQPFGGAIGGGGGGFRRGIDEVTLKQVADLTGGAYYSAESAGELQTVLNELPTALILRHEVTEISVFFAAAAALLATLALGLALLWQPLP